MIKKVLAGKECLVYCVLRTHLSRIVSLNLVAMTEVFAVFCRVPVVVLMVGGEKDWILSNLEVQPMGAMTLLMRLETLKKSV